MALTQNSKILASDVSGAIKSITRSGTTFTYTTLGGSTGTFTQQDNNTTYSAGTGISISGTSISNTGVTSVNGQTGAVTINVPTAGVAQAVSGFGDAVKYSSNNRNTVLPSGGTYAVLRLFTTYDRDSGYDEYVQGYNASGGSTVSSVGMIAVRIA